MVNEPATPPRLKGWLLMTIGLLAIVIGALWTVQGLDILPDSKMSGKSVWTFIGAGVAVVGLILTVIGERVRSRSKKIQH